MRHLRSRQFDKLFDALPLDAQRAAHHAYVLLKADPRHPSLHFKRLQSSGAYWSVRVGMHYRAIAKDVDGAFLWGWIGTHADYDRIIKAL